MNWTYLVFLACPLSMGLMMWWMMRMDHGSHQRQQSAPTQDQARLAELESQLNELKAAIGFKAREDQGAQTP